MGIHDKLLTIQTELKATKNQHNSFGNFNYRSCEDILEALKPLLHTARTTVTISDEIINIGTRFYVKATAALHDLETGESVTTSAYAREPENRPKMDDAQATGSSSSYARKYALNGLFLIDDSKDPDYTNTGQQDKPKQNRQTSSRNTSQYVQRSHINTIRAEIQRTGAKEEAVCYQYRIKRLEDMTVQQFKNAMEIFKGMPDIIPEGQQYSMFDSVEQYDGEVPFR